MFPWVQGEAVLIRCCFSLKLAGSRISEQRSSQDSMKAWVLNLFYNMYCVSSTFPFHLWLSSQQSPFPPLINIFFSRLFVFLCFSFYRFILKNVWLHEFIVICWCLLSHSFHVLWIYLYVKHMFGIPTDHGCRWSFYAVSVISLVPRLCLHLPRCSLRSVLLLYRISHSGHLNAQGVEWVLYPTPSTCSAFPCQGPPCP